MVKCEAAGVPEREREAQGVPFALARGIVPRWAEANHWVAIDGVAVKLPDSQALHCQPQSRTWRERTLNNEAALRVVAYAVRR
jgi:hypothetical protein